jgi:hypothetical protein
VRQFRVGALLVVAAVLLSACRADTRVEVTVNGDGTGTVRSSMTLDDEAIARLGGLDVAARQVPLGDLQRAGWKVSPWVRGAHGGATLTLTHAFHGESDLSARLADLVGTGGVVRDPHLGHQRGWFRSRDALSVVVDMRSPRTGIGSDADLRARVQASGIDPAALDAQLTSQLRSALNLTVVLHLPGGETRTYDAANGSFTTLHASDSHTDYDRMIQVGIAVVLAVLAGSLLLAASVGARRNRRRNAQRVRAPYVEQERAPLM